MDFTELRFRASAVFMTNGQLRKANEKATQEYIRNSLSLVGVFEGATPNQAFNSIPLLGRLLTVGVHYADRGDASENKMEMIQAELKRRERLAERLRRGRQAAKRLVGIR